MMRILLTPVAVLLAILVAVGAGSQGADAAQIPRASPASSSVSTLTALPATTTPHATSDTDESDSKVTTQKSLAMSALIFSLGAAILLILYFVISRRAMLGRRIRRYAHRITRRR